MSRGFALLLFVPLATAVAPVACAEERPGCYAGEYAGCSCASGVFGYAACDVSVSRYGSCVCDGSTPGVDAAAMVPDAAPDGAIEAGPRALFEVCTTDGDCASGKCFTYGTAGKLCTIACTGAEDCAPPSPGCNAMGVCRPP
jgi:hypothetical protein